RMTVDVSKSLLSEQVNEVLLIVRSNKRNGFVSTHQFENFTLIFIARKAPDDYKGFPRVASQIAFDDHRDIILRLKPCKKQPIAAGTERRTIRQEGSQEIDIFSNASPLGRLDSVREEDGFRSTLLQNVFRHRSGINGNPIGEDHCQTGVDLQGRSNPAAKLAPIPLNAINIYDKVYASVEQMR